jgi:hypothetical protein
MADAAQARSTDARASAAPAAVVAILLATLILVAGCSSAPTPPPSLAVTGPVLTVATNGPLACPVQPMGCVLSLEVVPGTGPWEPPVGYEPPPDHQFERTQTDVGLRPPVGTPMSIAPGPLRVIAVLTLVSDVVTPSGPSYMGIGWTCQTGVVVKPDTKLVSVVIALQGLLPCTISASLD